MSYPINVVAIYAGLNALILLGLSYNVGRHRARTDSLTPGAMGDDILVRAIRAHGNAAEYMPLALRMLLVLALLSAPIALLHAIGSMFTVGRLAQAIGMVQEQHTNKSGLPGTCLPALCTSLAPQPVSFLG